MKDSDYLWEAEGGHERQKRQAIMQRNWSGHDVCCRYVEASVKGIIVEEAM